MLSIRYTLVYTTDVMFNSVEGENFVYLDTGVRLQEHE